MLTKILVFVLFSGTISGFLVPDGLQVVHTRLGEIHGMISSVDFDGHQYHVKKFLGIPYAEPPVGNLRFRKPLPVKPFSSPFMATKYSPSCLQMNRFNQSMSEDCLYLNVIVPMDIGGNTMITKPVMVWIHGGGFYLGTGSTYDVDTLSSFTDNIIVTINYRLGVFGFFSTADQSAPGNFGLWDQHQALRWVHDNIAAFGGDPSMVTIFGQSAGSISVLYQIAHPGNRGLFRRAIGESGTASWVSNPYNLNYKKSISCAKAVGCNSSDHDDIVSCLRMKPVDVLYKYVQQDNPREAFYLDWVPVYDNDFVDPTAPELFSFYHEVDLLLGWNNLDGLAFVPVNGTGTPANTTITRTEFENVYVSGITEVALQETPTDLAKDAVEQEYTDFDNPDDKDAIMKNIAHMAIDGTLAASSFRIADAHFSNTSNTFIYIFGARPPVRLVDLPNVFDGPNYSQHGEEMIYVFGVNLFKRVVQQDPSKDRPWTPSEMRLTKAVMTMWGNFAKSGDPNKPISIKPYCDVNWEAYTNDNPVYLDISLNMTQSSVKSSNNYRGVDFWNNILPRIQKMSD